MHGGLANAGKPSAVAAAAAAASVLVADWWEAEEGVGVEAPQAHVCGCSTATSWLVYALQQQQQGQGLPGSPVVKHGWRQAEQSVQR